MAVDARELPIRRAALLWTAPNVLTLFRIAVVPECAEVGLGAVFAAPKRLAPERARMARYATTTLAAPAATALAACRSTPIEPPPP